AEAFARTFVAWRRVVNLPYRDAWVMRVTANVALDMARRRSRQARLPAAAKAVGAADDATAVRLALVAALRGLPRRQREVIVLRYLAGYSEAEVAAALGISVNTVKKHAQRALTLLRR